MVPECFRVDKSIADDLAFISHGELDIAHYFSRVHFTDYCPRASPGGNLARIDPSYPPFPAIDLGADPRE